MPERIKHTPLKDESKENPVGEIHLVFDQCKGCGYCIEFCPRKVFEESEEINARGIHPPKIVDESKCMVCRFCTLVCPDFAIYVTERTTTEKTKP